VIDLTHRQLQTNGIMTSIRGLRIARALTPRRLKPSNPAFRARFLRLLLAAGALWLPTSAAHAAPPRLVVLVSLDQFPREYLDRFGPLFGSDGFRRLLGRGADFRNCHHEYFTTFTGPGHSVMLTGAYPADTGIVDNTWYSREQRRVVPCVADDRFPLLRSTPVAVSDQPLSGVAPPLSLSTTVGDALRSATGMRSKVISLSLKDRAAVLMGGQRPDGAYWFDSRTCTFVTSTYYMSALPDWVAAFNAEQPCVRYVGGAWTKLDPKVDYTQFADADDAPYEGDNYGLGRAFPHPVNEFVRGGVDALDRDKDRYSAVTTSPFGSEMLFRFAKTAVAKEDLGRDAVPDLLALSFSSTDLVGHLYGPHSQEVLDMALRTDRLLADLMQFLDERIGRNQWLLALTSDHGVAPVPGYLERLGMLPPRADRYRFDSRRAAKKVDRVLRTRFFRSEEAPQNFPGFIEAWVGPFVYVNRAVPDALPGRVSFDDLLSAVRAKIENLDGVKRVYTRAELPALTASRDWVEQGVARSWHADNGGDLMVQLQPHWFDAIPPAATTHGGPYRYDTHVPMVLYGPGVRSGHFDRAVAAADLASTLARVLGVTRPPYDRGQPLREALR